MMREALARAKKARLEILDTMDKTLTEGRTSISTYAPRLYKLHIPTDKIRDLIGPGGKKIKSIIEATGVKIDVLEDGTVHIFSTSGAGGDSALQMVRDVTASAEIGKTYLGKVVRLAEFGAFVEIFPGTDGLLPVSEIAEHRVKEVMDELREGDQILVKVLAIEGNRIKLSRKAVLREQRAKLGLPEPGQIGTDGGRVEAVAAAPRAEQVADEVDEDGDDFDDDGEEAAEEPNFNRADGVPAVAAVAGGQGANGPGGQRRPGGRRRRGGRGAGWGAWGGR